MFSFTKYNNVDAAVINLAKKLQVNINPYDIIAELEKHPDYPSLLAVSDVLSWFKINNVAYRVTVDELQNVPVPFIASINHNKEFVTVNKLTADNITFSDQRSNHTILLEEFKKTYNGIVLSAEAPATATETIKQALTDQLAIYKVPAAITGLAVVLLGILFSYTGYIAGVNWQILLLTLFKTIGLTTSILLLVQSINKNNPLVQTLCGGGGKTDCNAILTSKAATVFKGLTWSEVGFFYFASTWLALLFGGGSISLLQALAILNIVSLPYTFWSINFQWRIAKQWCVLCTTVQALLWLEFIPFLGYLKLPLSLSGSDILSLSIFMILPVALWILLKPVLLKSQELKTLKRQLQKFKYNTGLFNTSLKAEPKFALPDEDWSIVLGNVEANTIITMVSNPYCPPCSKTHQELDEWLSRMDDIQLRIVFTANNDERDIKTPVTRHLMALNDQNDKALVKQALHDWYEQKQKSYEEWAKLYPVTFDETKYNTLEKQKAWCTLAEVTATPTLLVNGYRLPQAYRLHDIKYMLG